VSVATVIFHVIWTDGIGAEQATLWKKIDRRGESFNWAAICWRRSW